MAKDSSRGIDSLQKPRTTPPLFAISNTEASSHSPGLSPHAAYFPPDLFPNTPLLVGWKKHGRPHSGLSVAGNLDPEVSIMVAKGGNGTHMDPGWGGKEIAGQKTIVD